MIFQNEDLCIYKSEGEEITVVVYNPAVSNKLNKELGYYPKVIIKKGEEPIFIMTENITPLLNSLPKRMSKVALEGIIKKYR